MADPPKNRRWGPNDEHEDDDIDMINVDRVRERLAARGDVNALLELGERFLAENDLEEAQYVFELAANGGSSKGLRGLADVLKRKGDLEGAADATRRAEEKEAENTSHNGTFNLSARAVSDLPSAEDLLGFTPLVEGLRALLNARRTTLPLAIAITAQWGAGKSSVMLQLKNLLRDPGGRQPQERKWWTVDFPAWKYERSERLWAALAKAVYEQPQKKMNAFQRIWFRVRVERERLGLRKFLLKGIWPPVAAAAAVIVAMAANVDPAGSAPATAIVSSVAAFSLGAAHYWGLASMPFKRAIERYASAPDYDSKLGFTADADRDIRSLARILAPDTDRDPQALAVFVDDLDRCTSLHVVEVVEAMNQIFNSDGRHGCVFILGLDREVVATNIEVAYGPTVESLIKAERPVGKDFGMQFLAKLVQISVTVPQPKDAAVRRLLARITGSEASFEDSLARRDDVDRVEEEIRRQAPTGLAGVSEASSTLDASPEAIDLGERRVRAERIQDSPEVVAAEFEVLRHLGNNPRQIKRFDNAFRLQLYVANQDRDCELDFTLDELVALGRWVALRLRWPELAKALDDEPALLGVLEANANEIAPQADLDEIARLQKRYKRWLEDREILEFLNDVHLGEARRVSTLEPGSFLHVA